MFRSVIIGLRLLMMAQYLICQDVHFPVDVESDTKVSGGRPVTERKSLKATNSCPADMVYYPLDGAWVCACKPRYIHFPKDDTCHELFFRGPCPEHHYVYLVPNETVPKCMKNICRVEGLVYYKGVCHTLNSKGGPSGEKGVLKVNEMTYQLECVDVSNAPFKIISVIDAPHRPCPKGSRRNNLGMCKIVL